MKAPSKSTNNEYERVGVYARSLLISFSAPVFLVFPRDKRMRQNVVLLLSSWRLLALLRVLFLLLLLLPLLGVACSSYLHDCWRRDSDETKESDGANGEKIQGMGGWVLLTLMITQRGPHTLGHCPLSLFLLVYCILCHNVLLVAGGGFLVSSFSRYSRFSGTWGTGSTERKEQGVTHTLKIYYG